MVLPPYYAQGGRRSAQDISAFFFFTRQLRRHGGLHEEGRGLLRAAMDGLGPNQSVLARRFERAQLRPQALKWLRADLAAWNEYLKGRSLQGPSPEVQEVFHACQTSSPWLGCATPARWPRCRTRSAQTGRNDWGGFMQSGP